MVLLDQCSIIRAWRVPTLNVSASVSLRCVYFKLHAHKVVLLTFYRVAPLVTYRRSLDLTVRVVVAWPHRTRRGRVTRCAPWLAVQSRLGRMAASDTDRVM